jgi:programmed cell death protein 5
MDNLQPGTVDPSDLPEGFSTVDPSGAASQGQGGDSAPNQAQMDQKKQGILEQALTPEALARLRRIKLVKGAKVAQLENALVNMAVQGKLPGRVTEGKLIEMLERSNAGSGGAGGANTGIKIQRKKYAFDSDDEDDNDDDLM